MRKIFIIAAIAVLFMFAAPAMAQEGEGDEGIIGVELPVVEVESELPAWFTNIMVGTVGLGSVATIITQVIKIVGSRLPIPLPDGWGGYIALAVAIALTAVALISEWLGVSAEAGSVLLRIKQVAEAVKVLLGALGFYKIADTLNLLRGFLLPAWKSE